MSGQVSHEVRDFLRAECQAQNCFTLSTVVRAEKRKSTGVLISVRNGQDLVFDVFFRTNNQVGRSEMKITVFLLLPQMLLIFQ